VKTTAAMQRMKRLGVNGLQHHTEPNIHTMTSADDLFASLQESERSVRKQMAERVQPKKDNATPAAATAKVQPKKAVDVDAELRRLGLGPATASPAPSKAAAAAAAAAAVRPKPAPAPAPVPALAATAAAAPTPPASSSSTALGGVLAARKAQVSRAKNTELLGLRTADWDSDDDDLDGDAAPAQQQQPAAAPAGGTLAREANSLADANVGVRQRALARLSELELTNEQLKPLLQPLLLRFSDASERCREAAVALFRRWQARAAPSEVGGVLPFLMPVVVERLGTEQLKQEPAEEVRASLVSLVADVLCQCRQLLRPYLQEVGAIALGCCRDSHPEVVKGVAGLLRVVAEEVLLPMCRADGDGGRRVKPYSTKLLEAVLPHVRHRHAQVRLAVLGALEPLLLCGAGSSVETLVGWRLQNNVPIAEFYGKGAPRVNYLADLSRDASGPVRRRFVQACARWCKSMTYEELYEQEVRVAPYLLNGLVDDDEATRAETLRYVDELGDDYLHFPRYEDEYRTKVEYGVADERARDAAMSIAFGHPFGGGISGKTVTNGSGKAKVRAVRASFGARERFRAHFRCLIYPIVAELKCWTSKERLQSATLLQVVVPLVSSARPFGCCAPPCR